MKIIRILKAAALMSLIAIPGCMIGGSGKDIFYSLVPTGAQVVTVVRGSRATGELIAMRDDGVIVNSHGVLQLIPFSVLGELTIPKLGRSYRVAPREGISSEQRERLRLVSHFPHGLTPEIERLYLAQLGQQAIKTVQ